MIASDCLGATGARLKVELSSRCRKTLLAGSLSALAMLLAPHPGAAATALVVSSRDNTLYEDTFGSLSNGAGRHVFAGRSLQGAIRRAVLAFDLSGAVPPGSVVQSVVLTLHMSRSISGPFTVSLHRLDADWGEGTSQAMMGEGVGAPAAPGDATWTFSFFDTIPWSATGGDFAAAPSAQQDVDGIGDYSWGSTAEMVADVQGWVDDPATSFGWILVGDETTTSAKRFDSRDSGAPENFPRLEIVFTPPAASIPATAPWSRLALIALLAGLGAWALWRSR